MLGNLKEFYLRIDLRSLGLFRIVFGALLIYDWCVRWPNIEAFYTSFGVLPIDAPLPRAGDEFHFSMLDRFTTAPMVRAFFLLGLIAYVGFLVGYRTKLSHILAFVVFVSVSNRNILIRHGGDVVTLTMLAWALFLPLGKRFSLDAVIEAMRKGVDLRKRKIVEAAVPGGPAGRRETAAKPPGTAASPTLSPPSLAAFVIVCQIVLIYLMTAYAKCGTEWFDGTALWYALQLDQFATPLGKWLADQPLPALKALTHATLWMEYCALLFLLPIAQPLVRRVVMVCLTLLHLGISATMSIGSFPFVMIATYSLLLLPADWERIRRAALRWSRPVIVYYDDTCGFCYRSAQLLRIADQANYIHFIGNTDRSAFEHDLSQSEVDASIVVFDRATQAKTTRAAGMAAILRALPLPFHVFRVIAWPGLRSVSNVVYDWVARHRYRFSAWLGFQACGLERVPQEASKETDAAPVPTWQPFLRRAADVVVAVLFVCVLVDSYNLNVTGCAGTKKIHEPRWMQAIIQFPQLVHDWQLFAPYPMKDDGWWVIDGVTLSGQRVDPLTGSPPTFDRPSNLSSRFNAAWRKYLYRIWLRDFSSYRLYFGRFVTRKHHREHPDDPLDHFDFYYVEEFTLRPEVPKPWPTRVVHLSFHDCFQGEPNAPKNRPSRERKTSNP